MGENLVSLSGISKSHGGPALFSDLTLGIDAGEKLGIIGKNGAGKSTLLRLIAGAEKADSGSLSIRGGTRVGYLTQVPGLDLTSTVQQALETGVAELTECIAAYEVAATEMRPEADTLLEKIEHLGGWDYQHRIDAYADELGLPPLTAQIEDLSGGERKRVALAQMMLSDPDLLLLDEPTNHLDAETVAWLEKWLAQSTKAWVLVTHDRYFLDEVVQRLVEIRDGTLRSYRGNYTDYLEARALEVAQQERSHHKQLRLLMGELEWARRSPKARTTKSRARLDRIDNVKGEVERLTGTDFTADFRFGQAPRLGSTILELKDLTVKYDTGPTLIKDFNLIMRGGQCLGILGPNGAGKTTLVEVIRGALKPASGEVIVGINTKIAYFDQHRELLDPDATLRSALAPDGSDTVYPGGGDAVHVSSWLGRFGFASDIHGRPIATLSGGERNRLAIARFLLKKANLLILDEPTNDLDIPTLNLLEEAIADFTGCVLLVTHDRYLLDKVANGVIAFERDYLEEGAVTYEPGNYTHYREIRLKGLQEDLVKRRKAENKKPGKTPTPAATTKASDQPKPLSKKEQKELDGLEAQVEAAEGAVAQCEERLADPELWSDGQERGAAAQQELERAQAQLGTLISRWETLMERA